MSIDGVQEVTNSPVRRSNKPAQNADDSDYLHLYFQHLAGQFRMLDPTTAPSPAYEEAKKLAAIDKDAGLKWADLYQLEAAMLKLASLADLKRKVWSIRCEFTEIAGPDRRAAYLASNPPDAEKASEPELRADMQQLLGEIQWLYSVMPMQSGVRSKLTRLTLAYSAGVFGFLILLVCSVCVLCQCGVRFAALDYNALEVPLVLAAGMLGGLISTLRRIHSTPLRENVVVHLINSSNQPISVFVSPLLGAIFAVVLTMLFRGQFLSGGLFPAFWAPPSSATLTDTANVKFLLAGMVPASTPDYAKLLIWSFMAGFAEQLVPDALAKVSAPVVQEANTEKV